MICLGSGEEAVTYLQDHVADLILLDMIMAPSIDGLETYKRILEINPAHPLFASMKAIFEKDARRNTLHDFIRLLYDQALILEGSKPKDPAAFSKTIAKLMAENIEKESS